MFKIKLFLKKAGKNYDIKNPAFKLKILYGIFLLFLVFLLWGIAPGHTATYNVTNNRDDDNEGSLRWAVGQANSDPLGPHTIAFVGDFSGDSGIITLTNDLDAINKGCTFDFSEATGTITLKSDSADYFLGYSSATIYFKGGAMSISGGNAKMSGAGSINFGFNGAYTLNIEDGGQVDSGSIVIGSDSTSTVTVDGEGSQLSTGTASIIVGKNSTGTLNVENGGQVTAGIMQLGAVSTSKGTVTVDGANSKCTLSSNLLVGVASSQENALNITNGGAVSGKSMYVGFNTGSKGVVAVSGAGSRLALTNDSYLGYLGTTTGTLTISDDATVSVNEGAGTLTLGNNSTSSGTLNIGAGSAAGILSAATVTGGAGASTLNFNHNEASYAFAPNVAGTLDFNHTGAGKTVLTGSTTYTGTTTISAGTLNINQDRSLTGDVTLNGIGVLELDANTLTHTGGVYTQNTGTRLQIQLSDAGYGNISSDGTASVSANSTLDIDITGSLANGSYKIVNSASGSGMNVPNLTWNRPIFTITGSTSDNDLYVNVTKQTYRAVALNSTAAAVGQALDNASTLGDMAIVKGQIDALPTLQGITDALNSMAPVNDGAIINVVNDSNDQFVGSAILRLQDSKVEEEPAQNNLQKDGPPQNNMIDKNSLWVQAYGDYADQDSRDLSKGYRATIWGTVLGIDHLFMDGALRLGLAQGFGFGKIKSRDNYGRTSIDSYQTGLYGEYQAKDKPYIIDIALTYGYNDYDSTRNISIGNIARSAQSDYDGHQFSSYVEGGYKIEKNSFDIIPLIILDYTHLYLSSYTETGAESLNLSVDSQDYDSLRPGVGCRISRAFETEHNIITPELRFRYFYDVLGEEQQTIASFAGGGTSFQTVGYRPARSSFDLGARVEFFNKKNITMLTDCNAVFKDDYYEVGGSLMFKYSF